MAWRKVPRRGEGGRHMKIYVSREIQCVIVYTQYKYMSATGMEQCEMCN